MEFENSPTGDGGSYEKPKPGKYIGILVGFAFVGTQPGGQYGPKPKVMLRWELHKRKGPSTDSQGNPHTITATFGATIRGDNSRLRKTVEAHIGRIEEGQKTNSHDWLGKAAWLDVEWSDEDPKKGYANVVNVSPLDPEDDEAPAASLEPEHWEPTDGTAVPSWCRWAVAKSTDYGHLVPPKNGKPVAAGVGAGSDDDDDIPF